MEQARPPSREPIAIVGFGCRFPGGITSAQQFWDFLLAGGDALGEVPPERWEPYIARSPEYARAVRSAIKFGGYLDDIEGFDAEFFGISPREAELMDPQQRITLEVAWEALEHAGIVPAGLAGSDASVFMGVCCDDYGRRLLEDLPRLEAWTGIGSSLCGVANRVSYALDLRGPSVVVDTACSASLVALHQACQALHLGETSLALAGGVMLVTSPSFALVLEAAGALSPDGRSKAFDASADGYGRGEGCAVLVLKRLADARRDGDRVLALVRGSAVCQDGRTNGIMAPSQEAQENLVRRACANAGLSPATVDYVEAHGTGTGVGDPIEVGALAAVVGAGRGPGEPCLIGSVKTNIGHLEAASGAAGIIKCVLALSHGQIPATLSATGLNPDISWAGSGLKVVTENTPWPRAGHPRRAGIGNYGYGGTIAHVILEEVPAPRPPGPAPRQAADYDTAPRIYPLSGASAAGLRATAARLASWLDGGHGADLNSLGHTLAHRRSALPVRACVVAAGRGELAARLGHVAAGRTAAGVSTGEVAGPAQADPVWVFSGHGAQWAGMGRGLLSSEPALGQALDELEETYLEEIGFSPRRALLDDDLADVGSAQAMIFAMQVGLARVWQSKGVRPAAIIGHSVGEIAAAVVAGLLCLPDAARLICRRSRLLRRVAGQGRMAMVNLSAAEVTTRLAGQRDVSLAIMAAPSSSVVSGTIPAVDHLIRRWQAQGAAVRRVSSDVAFHSPDMDCLLADLISQAGTITPRPAQLAVYSTTLADPRSTAPRDASYWAANLRNPVRFADAVAAAAQDGHRTFLEVSTHPVVAHSIMETLAALGVTDGVVVHTLRRSCAERQTLLENLGLLHCHGAGLDWSVLQPGGGLTDLPSTAWQHQRYWVDAAPAAPGPGGHDVDSHNVLGTRIPVQGPAPVTLWQPRLDDATRPYPGSHAVLGAEILPAAVVLTSFCDAADRERLRDVSLRVPIAVASPRDVQVVRQDQSLWLSTRLAGEPDDQSWLTHATAQISGCAGSGQPPSRLPEKGCTETADPGIVMDLLAAIGVAAIGFPWQVEELRRSADSLLATVTPDPCGIMERATWGSLLDAALSVAPVVFPGAPLLRMPGQLHEVAVHGVPPARARVGVRLTEGAPDGDTEVDIVITTLDGTLAAQLTGVRYGVVRSQFIAEFGPGTQASAPDDLWRSLDGALLHDHMAQAVRMVVAGELRLDPAGLNPHRPLFEMGADSLLSQAIRIRLERLLRIVLPSTLLWDRPTAAAITDHLCSLLAGMRAAEGGGPTAATGEDGGDRPPQPGSASTPPARVEGARPAFFTARPAFPQALGRR
jgi:6-methylsalicylic acid synthase